MPSQLIQPRHPTAAAERSLTTLLGLSECGQDWEIELAAPDRVSEFLDVYEGRSLDEDERFALMELIVASYEELLMEGEDQAELRERIRHHLLERFDLHGYTVQYWARPDDDDSTAARDGPGFSLLAREVMAAIYGPRERWPREAVLVRRFIDRSKPLLPGMSVDAMQISDNRDGSGYTLWWCTYRDRLSGEQTFPSVAAAMEYAAKEFGVTPGRWTDITVP